MRCGVLRADLVVVSKKRREMVLLRGESVLRTYRIALGREPVGPKRQEGDGRTPEGRYIIDRRNAKSKYHLSLHISYPDAADVARAREAGVDPGGDIMQPPLALHIPRARIFVARYSENPMCYNPNHRARGVIINSGWGPRMD